MRWKLFSTDRPKLEGGRITINGRVYKSAATREALEVIDSGRDAWFEGDEVNEILTYYGVKTKSYANGYVVVHM